MKFVKKPLTIKERLKWFKHSFEWLPITRIVSYDHDAHKCTVECFDVQSRIACFLGGLETAIVGYVYEVK